MDTTLIIIIVISAAALFASIAAIVLSKKASGGRLSSLERNQEAMRAEIGAAFSSGLGLLSSRLSELTGQVNQQLSSVATQVNTAASQAGLRSDASARMLSELSGRLGELTKAAERIREVGSDIAGLETILKAPKMRGGLGEFFLGDILSQCLPAQSFTLQHTFRNGRIVDAAVSLSGGVVPIDAKFPLENFRRILSASGEADTRAARRAFTADCKRHIDAIASSYILPDEGTLNFALMYIPAENVYYETIVRDDSGEGEIASYALSRKVMPVSPNTLYVYLQTVVMGLRGLDVSERAEAIMAGIDALKLDFQRLASELDTLGRHLTNAVAKFHEMEKKAGRFSMRLDGLGSGDAPGDGPAA